MASTKRGNQAWEANPSNLKFFSPVPILEHISMMKLMPYM